MNLKSIGLAPAIALALLPLATQAQTTAPPPKSAQPRVQITFTSPLKIVGADGHYIVRPRNFNTEWNCAEGQPTQIVVGSPPAVVYTLSPDGNVLTASANGATLRLDIAKAQFATAPSPDAIDAAPMKAFATLSGATPTLLGTSPTALTTGFELLYTPTAGLTGTVKMGTRGLGAFSITGSSWQIGFFPLDDAPSADTSGATPPPARGDVVITGAPCKGSPVPGASPSASPGSSAG